MKNKLTVEFDEKGNVDLTMEGHVSVADVVNALSAMTMLAADQAGVPVGKVLQTTEENVRFHQATNSGEVVSEVKD